MKTPSYDKNTLHHYFNGRWCMGRGEAFVSINPADNQIIWQGTKATIAEVAEACEAAQAALPPWASLGFDKRVALLQRFTKKVSATRQKLAYLISLETGKPLWEAQGEVNSVIAKTAISIAAYQERTGAKTLNTSEADAYLRFKPLGVVAVLGAFNFPAHLSNGHIIPALLAGNTVVYKPSELTPAVAQFIMQCWHESGLPPGVINCVQGGSATGQALLASDIQAIYFTGSYKTGKQIHQNFSDRPDILLALEMGGNNALIVDKVSNLDAAIYHSLLSTLLTSGQRCTCARRVLVRADKAGDRFLARFIAICKTIRIADFREKPEPFMGPVISQAHAQRHLHAQEKLLRMGGLPLLSMSLLAENTAFLSPGIIDMTCVRDPLDEEIFAPLVQIHRYENFAEALELANKTRYGLVAGLLSDDPSHYQQFYQTVRAGLINWNRPTTGAIATLPFGGVGWSGNHRPSAYFAADYCAYPIASLEHPSLTLPAQMLPGVHL